MATLRALARLAGALQIGSLLALLYHYYLLLAGARAPSLPAAPAARRHRFALAIPAHNEAAVIGATVRNFKAIDYPSELFDVVVVADHCQDATAAVAREAGAIAYERHQPPRGRKGYALAWLLQRLLEIQPPYDAIVVLDADSRVNSRFLTALNDGLHAGYEALQGRHLISNSDASLYNSLAAVDLRLNNRLRNAARHNLGSSARLMGDAMCFTTPLLRRFPWNTFSLVEDVEYGVELLLAGVRIGYVPGAESHGQAAGGWQQASRQRARWEGGFLDLRRRLPVRLLAAAVRQRRLDLLDRAVELLLPPFSLLTLLSVCLLFIQTFWRRSFFSLPRPAMAAVVAGWGAFPFIGLWLDGAPAPLYRRLAFGPLFLLWRVGVTLTTLWRRDRVRWVRTPRSEES